MTVKELIDDLQGYDSDLEVVLCTSFNNQPNIAQFADYTYLDSNDESLHRLMPIKADRDRYAVLTKDGFVAVINGCETNFA